MNQNIISTDDAKNASVNDLKRTLSSSEVGISTQEAEKRLMQYGYNEISEKKINPIIKFLRDDKWQQIPARELVPGDIVRVRLGEIIPADIKLMEGNYLLVDESTLTGESCPWRNIFQMSGSRTGIYLND